MASLARLDLRLVEVDDLDWLVEHWNRPAVYRFLFDGHGPARSYIDSVIKDSTTDRTASGARLWVLILRSRGARVGVAGLRPLDDLGPELYYSLEPDVWGRGLALEAARLVVDEARESLGIDVVHAEVDAANTASRRVLERLGMTAAGSVPGALGELLRFRLQLS